MSLGLFGTFAILSLDCLYSLCAFLLGDTESVSIWKSRRNKKALRRAALSLSVILPVGWTLPPLLSDTYRATFFSFQGYRRLNHKRYEDALESYDRSLAYVETDGGAHHNRGIAHIRLQHWDKAAADFSRAVELKQDGFYTRLLLGSALLAQRDHPAALKALTDAIEVGTSNSSSEPSIALSHAYQFRADALLALGNHPSALEDLRRSLTLNTKNPGTLNTLAWTLATSIDNEVRDGRTAVEHARTACELTDWSNGAYIDTLAAAYAEVGDFKEAERWQAKAVELEPDGPAKKHSVARLELYRSGTPYRESDATGDDSGDFH